MRTLFLNPPSFEGFDGGASSRWPASREIESYWYPVWLCYPAGMLPDSKVVDAPPHKISIEQTVAMASDFELLVLFTSTPGFHVDVKIAEMMKDVNPKLKVAFVGPPGNRRTGKESAQTPAIDFVVKREFDHQIVDLRQRQAARGNSWRGLSQERRISAQSRRRLHRESRRASLGHARSISAISISALQRSVSAESVHFVLHVARLPGHVHVLPVAADALRPPLAPALDRRHCRTNAGTCRRISRA